MKVVIVGGVAGGASAAARLRRLDETAEIIIFERSGFVSYANCGLPYYIGGIIGDEDELTLQTPESFRSRFNIDVRVRHEVTSVNRGSKTVTVTDLSSGKSFEESYDKLVLSPGAAAVKPPLPGIEGDKIYTLRTVEDTFKLKAAVSSVVNNSVSKKGGTSDGCEEPKGGAPSAVVIGGGFIGVETAENLKESGFEVTVVERLGQLLSQFDGDMASFVNSYICKRGIKLMLGTSVAGFEQSGRGVRVILENREPIEADMAVLAIGVAPESGLAKAAGLELGLKNSIAVNEHMQTSDPDIYAVGDAVQIKNFVTGQNALISLAGPANKQGRIAADNIAGIKSVYKGSAASSVLKIFGMAAASTGINERAANTAGIKYGKVILSPASHASYYPGGSVMTVKLLFEIPSERILGAQIIGTDGVDKRIDVLAAAMQAGMKVTALKDLDLAYAPPFSSAKDPVNMAGFIAENVLAGRVKQFFYEDLATLPREGVTLLDTRTAAEYSRGHAGGFELNIPVDELRERLSELDRNKPVYVMCQSGLRSYIACRILEANGFTAYNFAGGYRFYESNANNRFDETCKTSCGL